MSQLKYKIFEVYQYSDLKKYFKKIPTQDFVVNKLLPCFGFDNFEDTREVNSSLLVPINEKIKKIIPELCSYINDITIKKAYIYNQVTFYKLIILLKNFINCFGLTIKRRKVNYSSTTKVYYSMIKLDEVENSNLTSIQHYYHIETLQIKATIKEKEENISQFADKFQIHKVKTFLEF